MSRASESRKHVQLKRLREINLVASEVTGASTLGLVVESILCFPVVVVRLSRLKSEGS